MNSADVLAAIHRQRAIPVVRASDGEVAGGICRRLIRAGLPVIELTTTIPGWGQVLADLAREEPTAVLGMGTITDRGDAEAACAAGASFLVTPFPVPAAREIAERMGTLFIGGGFTPAEVAESCRRGPSKLFPAHVGGIAYLKTLKAILPDSQIMPTGGIPVGGVRAWLAAGAFAVGVGSDLYGSLDFDAAVAQLLSELSKP